VVEVATAMQQNIDSILDVDLTDAQVLSDDRPVFDKLNNKWNEEWRQLAVDNVLAEVANYKIPFFR
jgi:hypothetical protein